MPGKREKRINIIGPSLIEGSGMESWRWRLYSISDAEVLPGSVLWNADLVSLAFISCLVGASSRVGGGNEESKPLIDQRTIV